jgi:hypothetical protein
MNQSIDIDKLASALCKAQAMMGGAVKDSANPFFKSKYADLTSVVKAIKEPFAEHDLSYVQFPYSTERGVGVTTRLMHSSGQWLEARFVLPITKQDPQAAGSAVTYARRYALQSMAGIPTADDDAESAMLRQPQTISSSQQIILSDICRDLSEENNSKFWQWMKKDGITDLSALSVDSFHTVKDALERTYAKQYAQDESDSAA